MGGRIEVRRHGADHGITHAVEQVVVSDIAGAEQPDAGFVEPTLDELPDERIRERSRIPPSRPS